MTDIDPDVELVARTIAVADDYVNDGWRLCVPAAEQVVAELRKAGRLAPAGCKLEEQYAVRVDEPHPKRHENRGDLMTHLSRETTLHAPRVWAGWTVVRRLAFLGPWEEVGPDAAERGQR